MTGRILVIALLTLTCSLAGAADPSPLQDFCVADLTSTVFVNGYPCKPPNTVTSDDFFYSGLNIRTDTNNLFGFNVTGVVVQTLPGLNTLGVSLGRIDYAYRGLNPPHTHPRATEIFTCLEGTLLVGFVSSSPDNKFYSKVLHAGDVFIFPQAMIHFQFNVGKNKAVALVAFGSQNPGLIPVANAMFGSHPPIDPVVLAKTFQLDKKIVLELQAIFGAM